MNAWPSYLVKLVDRCDGQFKTQAWICFDPGDQVKTRLSVVGGWKDQEDTCTVNTPSIESCAICQDIRKDIPIPIHIDSGERSIPSESKVGSIDNPLAHCDALSLPIILSSFFGNKPSKTGIEHWHKMWGIYLVKKRVSYLQKVLIIVSSKLLHGRGIVVKFPNGVMAKQRYLAESKPKIRIKDRASSDRNKPRVQVINCVIPISIQNPN